MTTVQTSSRLGPISKLFIGVVGTVVSILVTMQLKKMLEARSLPERSEDLKVALRGAGASAIDLKQAAATWIAQKASSAADSTRATATSTADSLDNAASHIKERTNG